jgi:electron transfer flavoprotein beta subunit
VNILVCVKRVPMVGGRISLLPDGRQIDTRQLGFTISPHEECAVEEAVRLVERHGGAVTVLTLGPPEAEEQLRNTVAVGAASAVLLVTERADWGPAATAEAIVEAIRRQDGNGGAAPFDLLLLGNEAADSGDYQVGVRVSHLLGLPCVTGIKSLQVEPDGDRWTVAATREYRGVSERFSFDLPAVVTVKEGINLPRYPSLPGRMRAKKATVAVEEPPFREEGFRTEILRVPAVERRRAEVIGRGPEAVPALLKLFEELGVLP